MSRLKERAKQKAARRKQAEQADEKKFWAELCSRIEDGMVIPIISNSVFYEQLIKKEQLMEGEQSPDLEQPVDAGENTPQDGSAGEVTMLDLNIEDKLSEIWAEEIEFPLPERHMLARVALYDRVVNSKDDRQSNTKFLTFLKDALLFLAEESGEVDEETAQELRSTMEKMSFADLAVELGYPKYLQDNGDPVETLAKLKLPIYITTSPFDFLERAIIADGNKPQTQVCFLSGEPAKLETEHKPNYELIPTPEEPLVFHLFGLEKYPESMVLNEDDYLDFLTKISKQETQNNPHVLPLVKERIGQSSLMVLGYRLRDWEFRVMMQGLIKPIPSSGDYWNLAIQMDPRDHLGESFADKIREYMKGYFKGSDFDVNWNTPQGFMTRLWKEWELWRRGLNQG